MYLLAPAIRWTDRDAAPTSSGARGRARGAASIRSGDEAAGVNRLSDRNGDGKLEDASGRPVSVHARSRRRGGRNSERGGAVHPRFVEEDRRHDGASPRSRAGRLIERFVNGANTRPSISIADRPPILDPGTNPDFWFSSGTRAPWEHRAEDAGDRLGAPHRRADGDSRSRRSMTRRTHAHLRRSAAASSPSISRWYFAAPRVIVAQRARTNRDARDSTRRTLWSRRIALLAFCRPVREGAGAMR